MICDICKLNEAAVSVEQVADGVTKNIYLCRSCSQRLGFGTFSENIDISITKLFNRSNLDNNEIKASARCPHCGKILQDIELRHKIGCENCFLFFKDEIMRILSQKKENLQYSGSVPDIPPASFTEKQSAAELRQKLIQAVEIEDYETAAALRDELKALEKNHGSKF